MLARGSGQVCYGCSKAGASPLCCSCNLGVRSDPPTIRQLTTRATALEMAAQLPALQWSTLSSELTARDQASYRFVYSSAG
eukprot:scaffold24873_cov37-Phaeocystis_antarctica.AAC.1